MSTLASRLDCRVTLYARDGTTTNAIGEDGYAYAPVAQMWAEIVPASETDKSTRAEEEYVLYTHKITVRAPTPVILSTDMFIVYQYRRFDIVSWEPHYKHRDRIVIRARLEEGRQGVFV